MNGLPYIQTAENVFYLENGPAYLDRPVGATSITTESKQTTTRPTTTQSNRFGFNKSFLIPAGIVRVLLLVFLTAGWISVLFVVRNMDTFTDKKNNLEPYVSTRIAYLVIGLMSVCISIGIFIINILNIPNMACVKKVPWLFLFVLMDVICMGLIFAISIAAAVREKQILDMHNSDLIFQLAINKGAFAAAASFGLFSSFLYFIAFLIWEIQMIMEKNKGGVSPFTNAAAPKTQMQSVPRPSFGRTITDNSEESQHNKSITDSSDNNNNNSTDVI